MLRKIPDSAVPYCRDGVLGARRLGLVEDAERLAQHARKRAADIAAAARADAERQFEAASHDGYRHGLERALSTWVPSLVALLEDEAQLKSRTRQALDRYLERVLTDAGVEAALIARCREGATRVDDTATGPWTLYLPDGRDTLLAQLSDAAPDVLQVRRGDAPWPVLERGDVVIEIDPRRPATRHLAGLLDADALQDTLERHARAYASDALRALRDADVRNGIRHDPTGDAP